jgi:hypothetical protein
MTDLEVREEASNLHAHADRCSRIALDHSDEIDLGQLEQVVAYHDYLREQATKLESLSYRLREQGRRLKKEQASPSSCRYCGEPGEWIEGVCVSCDVTRYAPLSTPQEDGRG